MVLCSLANLERGPMFPDIFYDGGYYWSGSQTSFENLIQEIDPPHNPTTKKMHR